MCKFWCVYRVMRIDLPSTMQRHWQNEWNTGPVLAPNWTYPCTTPDGRPVECFAERLGAVQVPPCSQPGGTPLLNETPRQGQTMLQASCAERPGKCMDALTRGLMGPLYPVLHPGHESVFPDE